MRFDQILKELRLLHTEKSKQYGTDVDPLANIRRSKELDVSPSRYCLIEAGNCMERAKNLLLGRNKEDYRNVFNDGASWFILARIFWEEEQATHIVYTDGQPPKKETLGDIWGGNKPGPGGCEHRSVLGGVCQKCGSSVQKPDNPMPSDVE